MAFPYKLANYVNENLSFSLEWEDIFGTSPAHGNIYCPFHENTDTPSAKIYGNGLKCFSCNRYYRVFDLLRKFAPSRLSEIETSVVLPAVTEGKYVKKFEYAPMGSFHLDADPFELFDYLANYTTQC